MTCSTSSSATMTATRLLASQHRQVLALLKKAASAQDVETRRRLLQAIEHHLTTHARIEEDVFYPAVKELAMERPRRWSPRHSRSIASSVSYSRSCSAPIPVTSASRSM